MTYPVPAHLVLAESTTGDQKPDPRPGFYYVSAIDGPRWYRIAGPYADHASALADVDRVRGIACDADGRARAFHGVGHVPV